MALPPQAIERLTKETSHESGWSGSLLMFTSVLFFLSLASYFGLKLGYQPYLASQNKSLDGQLAASEKSVSDETNLKIQDFYSQLVNLKKILNEHNYGSALFRLIESSTHPNAYWTRADYNTASGQVSLTGFAKSVKDIAQQVNIWQQTVGIAGARVSGMNLQSNGLWQFEASLTLAPDTLNSPPAANSAEQSFNNPAYSASSGVATPAPEQ